MNLTVQEMTLVYFECNGLFFVNET